MPAPNNTNPNPGSSRARVGGSGFTVFTWQKQPIAFARQISIQSQTAVGAGTTPIHPLDEPFPVELITAQAATMGQMILELYAIYNENVWDRLAIITGAVDIVGIFQAVANSADPIVIQEIIKPPRINGKVTSPYTVTYHNCVVSALDDGITVEVGTMEVLKRLTVNYAYLSRGDRPNPTAVAGQLRGATQTGNTTV